jgi:hypothetical protein
MPGRRSPPMPDSVSPQWASSALTSVPEGRAGRGMHHHAGRFVDDDQIAILPDHRQGDIFGQRLDLEAAGSRRRA